MAEALGVIDAPPAIDTNTPAPKLASKPGASQRSSLGGGAQILKGFQDLTSKFSEKPAADKSAIPAEKPLPVKVEKKADGTVEKTEAEKAAEAAKLQSTEGKDAKGTDGMTSEERAAFVAEKKASEGWKTEKETISKQLADLQKQLDTEKSEREKAQSRLKEVEPVALIQDIKLHDKYKDTIEKPEKEINDFLGKVCKKYELKPGELNSAIWHEDEFAGNEALAEMQANMDDKTAKSFSKAIDDLRALDVAKEKLRKDPEGAWTALTAEKKRADEEAKIKADKTYKMAKDAVWEALPESLPFLKEVFKNKDLADEIKKEADAVDWSEMSPDAKAFFAFAGSLVLRQGNLTKADKDEIAQLKSALANATKQTTSNGLPHKEADGGDGKGMKPSEFLRSKGMLFR